MAQSDAPREIGSLAAPALDYSICTLVTDAGLYRDMVQSFVDAGFTGGRCEYIYADNATGNTADGYRGLNRMIAAASGRIVILVHQDVLAIGLIGHLDAALKVLDETAPDWAVAGNAGFDATGWRYHRRLTESDLVAPIAPGPAAQVVSLDENLLILRKDALLGFSHDLGGFHLYGTDLVLQAGMRGRTAWVIDFPVEHMGRGKIDARFVEARDAMERKYRALTKGRTVRTPITWLELGRKSLWTALARLVLGSQVRGGWRRPLVDFLLALRERPRAVLGLLPIATTCRIGGLRVRVPASVPQAIRVALHSGAYGQEALAMVERWVPAALPVVELGGSYGIVGAGLLRRGAAGRKIVVAGPDKVRAGAETLKRNRVPAVVIDSALAFGAGPGLRLGEVLAAQGIDGDFALVSNLGGAEYDLLQAEPAVLQRCAVMVVTIDPAAMHDRRLSVRGFLRLLEGAGFVLVDTSGAVIAARRG